MTTVTNQRPDPSSVFVIHGRDERARSALFSFLRALGLKPMEWNELVLLTGKASPFIGEVLNVGFKKAQAAIVLLTPDDIVRLRVDYWESDDEDNWHGQPRPNVYIETGMALALHPDRTIIVQLGAVRPASDLDGRVSVKLNNESTCRNTIAVKLRQAGCSVNTEGQDWLTEGNFTPSPGPNAFVDINAEHPEPDHVRTHDQKDTIDVVFITVLSFGKLIHHHFHMFAHQGLHTIGTAARSLIQTKSEGNQPLLIDNCYEGWSSSMEARFNITENVLENLQQRMEDVENALHTILSRVDGEAAQMTASSKRSFQDIGEALSDYEKQFNIISRYFDQSDEGNGLGASSIEEFSRIAMQFTRTVNRLISRADSMIKSQIGAIEAYSFS